ncbi:hypothetical protein [Pseudovibrio flavus]|nr:hypothetical protein [Pseudovibrio flavus]
MFHSNEHLTFVVTGYAASMFGCSLPTICAPTGLKPVLGVRD